MKNISEWIYDVIGMSHSIQYKILATLIIGFLLYLIRRLVLHFVLLNVEAPKVRYNWEKSLSYTNYVVFFIIIAPIWITELQSMGTFLGLLSAGLAIALKDPISNFFAWIYILIKKPFEMGDRIQIGEVEGDVLNISFFEFSMLEIKNWVQADQSTGRIIHVPNGLLFTKPVINYNQAMDYIWNEIPVVVTFESDWKKAKAILQEIEEIHLKPMVKKARAHMKKALKEHHVYYSSVSPTVYTAINPNGVRLTLRYLCNPRKRRSTEQMAVEAILEAFAKHPRIQFAYPTTRFFDASRESTSPPPAPEPGAPEPPASQ